VSFGGVFNYEELIFSCQCINRIHAARMTEEMHHNDAAGLGVIAASIRSGSRFMVRGSNR